MRGVGAGDGLAQPRRVVFTMLTTLGYHPAGRDPALVTPSASGPAPEGSGRYVGETMIQVSDLDGRAGTSFIVSVGVDSAATGGVAGPLEDQ